MSQNHFPIFLKPIVLIGLPKSGKSTLGRYLSAQMGLKFVDLDELIEFKHQKTKTQVFNLYQEEGFRKLELEEFYNILKLNPDIIAVGGGARIKRNSDYLCCWIKPPVDVVVSRLDSTAPYLKGKKFSEWLEERLQLYRSQSDLEVFISGTDVEKDCEALWGEILGARSSL